MAGRRPFHTGQPLQRRWLVEGVFPQAQAALIAAAGGVGKSFLLLALTREVAAFDGVCGGALSGHGVAIYITVEDDAIEVHNRLNALGPIPDRLYVLPLPDAGGAVLLFAPDLATRGPAITAAWMDLERQLKANGHVNLRMTTFLRYASGLLVDCTDRLRQTPEPEDLLSALKSAIARAARDGQPYTKTGGNGLYECRHELPEAFHTISKHRLIGWVDTLLAQGELITAMAEGSSW